MIFPGYLQVSKPVQHASYFGVSVGCHIHIVTYTYLTEMDSVARASRSKFSQLALSAAHSA